MRGFQDSEARAMTITTSTSSSGPYTGAGTTGPFTVGFRFLADSHLKVIKKTIATGAEQTLVLTTDYTVTGAGSQSGGTVTLTVTLTSSFTLTIQRNVPYTQETDYTQSDPFPAQSHEDALDKLTMLAQQLKVATDSSIRVPETAFALPTVAVAATRASKMLGFDANGDPTVLVPASGSAADVLVQLANTATTTEGDALVGVKSTATGSVATTQHEVNERSVSVLDFMTSAQRTDVLARTGSLDVAAAIQAGIDHVSGTMKGGTLRFPSGVYRINSVVNGKSYVSMVGEYGETAAGGGTAESGTRFLWGGGAGNMLRFFNARMFNFEGFCLDGNSLAAITGILVDGTNNPSGSQIEFRRFAIRNCHIGVQWGTSGIAGGSYANDGTRFSNFTIWSSVANSKGFVINSGNAGQMSVIESGGIQTKDIGIDVVVANILQVRRVFGGEVMDTAFIRSSVGIDLLIEGCASECWGTGRTWRTNRPKFLKVIAPTEVYPVIEATITMSNNQINNPIEVGYPVRIVSTGDAWGYCKDYTTGVDEGAKGNFIAAPAWSAVTAYVANKDAVTVGGINYRCILAHTNQSPPNATYWRAEPSYVVAINNGVNPASTDLTTNEPIHGWIDSAFVDLTNLDPGRGWVVPAFSAGHWTANGSMTWTVAAGDVETYAYVLANRTMTVAFKVATSTIGGTLNSQLRIAIPNGKVATRGVLSVCRIINSTTDLGICYVDAGGTVINVQRNDASNFIAGTDNVTIQGQITFEVK